MKTHTSSFKEQIKLMGKEIDSRITFGSTVLGKDDLNAVTPSYQGAILKSVMKQLDIDSNVEIPIGTILKYEFGLKVNGEYEYVNYGNYVVYSVEKQEDTKSYKITCYDKLLYSMLDYVKLPITYPISIRDYINAISTTLGLKFANKSGTFANYNKQIQADLYDGLGYTFRDILDELAQVTASTICLNNNDELEIRYITETGDTIDEEYLKDVNVNFGEKFGAVNTIVLSRSGDSDSVYYPSVLPANPYEIKISDNQIMNGNDRADFLPDIYNKLNGLEFYTNDFVSTGICYYDLCDRYSVKVGENTYSCVMFNDEVLVTQGLEENIYTELPEQTETDYKHASKDDRMINQVYLIVKKNEAEILAVINTTEQLQKEINPIKDESGSEIIIEDASDNPLTYLEIEGKSVQDGTPTPDTPVEIESVGYENLFNPNNLTNNVYVLPTGNMEPENSFWLSDYIEVNDNEPYVLNYMPSGIIYYGENKNFIGVNYDIKNFTTKNLTKYIRLNYKKDSVTYENANTVMMNKGDKLCNYIPYGKYGIEVETVGKNLFGNLTWDTSTYRYFKLPKENTYYTLSIRLKDGATIPSDLFLGFTEKGIYSDVQKIRWIIQNGSYGTSQKKDNFYYVNNFTSDTLLNYISVFPAHYTNSLSDYFDIQLEESDKFTEYIPYQKNISVIELNAPLRSLPNGVKDIAYIKNNKLYVDRYVGSVVLDGSENWLQNGTYKNVYFIENYLTDATTIEPRAMLSDYFAYGGLLTTGSGSVEIGKFYQWTLIPSRLMLGYNSTSLEEFKTWLSNNNVQVDYELATPVTEEIGEIEMLKTLKGYNNISTTDEFLPIINLTYVRDTIIADYVENHVAELKLTENEIKASVESVSSSVDGLNTTINRVEEITNDNSQVINIISTNIDRTTGEVREVTTTNGFKFDSKGLNIYTDENSYNTQIDNVGTYYKDGNEVISQTTKDGSLLKNLKMQGQTQYSFDGDSYDFIEERVEIDGEYCYATFYNGEE